MSFFKAVPNQKLVPAKTDNFFPLVAIIFSIPGHRISNWNLLAAMLMKLHLPIYNPNACPLCWCGKTHDYWGDYVFGCKENNKIMAHHFIRDGWATSLQQVIATAGYILSVSKLETENPHLLDFNIGVKPLDLTFNIDPSPSLAAPAPCEYFCIDGDVTITPSVEPLFCSEFLNIIDTVTVSCCP